MGIISYMNFWALIEMLLRFDLGYTRKIRGHGIRRWYCVCHEAILESLRALHKEHLLHTDVKPDNICFVSQTPFDYHRSSYRILTWKSRSSTWAIWKRKSPGIPLDHEGTGTTIFKMHLKLLEYIGDHRLIFGLLDRAFVRSSLASKLSRPIPHWNNFTLFRSWLAPSSLGIHVRC